MDAPRDQHQFLITDDDVPPAEQAAFFAWYDKTVRPKQQRNWDKFLSKHAYFHLSPDKSEALKKLCRNGIPQERRPDMWMLISGAKKRMLDRPGYFEDLLDRYKGKQSEHNVQIERDLARTFPLHPRFQSEAGRASLERVLVAFSRHNPSVGYCQSMNFVAGFLLMFLPDEHAFWLLTTIVEDILPAGYYSDDLVMSTADQRAFDDIFASKRPKLHAHLAAHHVTSQIVTSDWFLGLFTTALPPETVLRFLDAFLNEGTKVLFRVALALFMRSETRLMKLRDPGDLLAALRSIGRRAMDADALWNTAFTGVGSFPMKRIEELRATHLANLKQDVAQRDPEAEWQTGVTLDENRHRMQLFMLGDDNTASPSSSLKNDPVIKAGATASAGPSSQRDDEPMHVTGFRVRLGG